MYTAVFIFQLYHNFSHCQLFFFDDHLRLWVAAIPAYFDALEGSTPAMHKRTITDNTTILAPHLERATTFFWPCRLYILQLFWNDVRIYNFLVNQCIVPFSTLGCETVVPTKNMIFLQFFYKLSCITFASLINIDMNVFDAHYVGRWVCGIILTISYQCLCF